MDNVTQFPGPKVATSKPPSQPEEEDARPNYTQGGTVRIIDHMPAATPEGTRVSVGGELRASINRIGEWLEVIDAMRADLSVAQTAKLTTKLEVIEGALAGIVFTENPPPHLAGGKSA